MDHAGSRLLPRNPRTDPEVIADCELILDAALAWQRDELPLNALMQLGAIEDPHGRPSPKYSRWVAMGTAAHDDPRKMALVAALTVVAKAQGALTTQGFFTSSEIRHHDDTIRRPGMDRDPWNRRAA